MTAQTHNFDPAAAMAYQANVTVFASYTDANGTEYEGEAFFMAAYPFEDAVTDLEFIGAVLFCDDNTTLIFHGHEGAQSDLIERAKEAA
jgi:calcineurin-like phosphoesterase family protein